jgi:predicted nucleotidyltransferase
MRPSERLNVHREAVRRIVSSHRASNPRVFGSTARGEDTEESDLDILIDPTGKPSLFNIGAMYDELTKLLGVEVDILTPGALPDKFRERVLAEATPI